MESLTVFTVHLEMQLQLQFFWQYCKRKKAMTISINPEIRYNKTFNIIFDLNKIEQAAFNFFGRIGSEKCWDGKIISQSVPPLPFPPKGMIPNFDPKKIIVGLF